MERASSLMELNQIEYLRMAARCRSITCFAFWYAVYLAVCSAWPLIDEGGRVSQAAQGFIAECREKASRL